MAASCELGSNNFYLKIKGGVSADFKEVSKNLARRFPGQNHNWGLRKTLIDHFARHGKDFDAKSPVDYADKAERFFRESQQKRYPTKIDNRGIIRVYDASTNTFGSYNPDGSTRTFLKPTRKGYWSNQKGEMQ